jgi:hypothetical protein
MNPLLELADRVEAAKNTNNLLDVECEIALFKPDDCETAIRANAAGTKVILSIRGGRDRTVWARDYTLTPAARSRTAASLRAIASMGSNG